ncbi:MULTISPECIES: TonB-dependent siderophore receptor [unclassified Duganella]|uniref:TonB-dependent siderophore receptor n=1 Tax=unclassified Duganella TaxID=2636909 RepID=UPI000E3445E1|nr:MULTISPECIES: TonB-dependent siderophore receptor [unclassified Duganella]RFP09204.1 TonB-dependent siderophore receptor [Duganella sp. BJB475]RFP25430.1 TonB-dependent siderophore receptor [Duganella sp. BJB476]
MFFAVPSSRLAFCLTVALPVYAAADPLDLAAAPQAMDAVEVVGVRQPYRSLSATAATKTETALKDLPQSARVLTADLLRDAGVDRFADALDLGSGISRQNNFGGVWDSYAVRGFTGDPNYGSDFLVNGFSSSRGYNGLRDLANVSSIEILKGPAAALYGRGEAGGIINIMTKKPGFSPSYTIEQSVGSHDIYRSAADLTGPLGETVAYRVNAAYEQGDSFRDTLSSKRRLISPSLIWRVSDNTTVSYELEQIEQQAYLDRGVVAVQGVLGRIPNSRFLGEPADGPMTIHSNGNQIFVQHDFNADWSLQGGLSYRSSLLLGYSTEASALQGDGRTLWRQRRFRDFSAQDWSGRAELLGKVVTGAVQHHLLVGADGYRFVDDRLQLRKNPSASAPYAIDIYHPAYGGMQPTVLGPSLDTREQQWSTAVYLQDQIELGSEWKALFGLRRDSYRQTIINHNKNGLANRQSLDASSPRVGLVYQPNRQASLYVSAGKAFRPNSGIGIDNESFPAESSRAYEAGIKFDSGNGKLSSTLALYSIKKKNVLTLNPLDTNFSLAAGEVGSMGVELDVAGELARTLQMSFSYAYTDAKVLRDNVLAVGGRLANVPKQSANLLLTHEIKLGGASASVGGGFNYVGERNGDVAISSTFKLPAYTTTKLLSSYAPNSRLRLSLEVDNLFDKAYYQSAYQQTWVAPGEDRRARLTARYTF